MPPVRREFTMEYLGAQVTQAVADTDATVEIPLPTSETEQLAMLIHQVEFEGNVPGLVAGATLGGDLYLHRLPTFARSGAALHIDDPTLIAAWMRVMRATAGGVVDLCDWYQQGLYVAVPPVLIALGSIYLTIHTSATTVVNDGAVRIGYTLERVTSEVFIAALVGWR